MSLAQLTLDCSAPELQDMVFSRESSIPAADTSLVVITGTSVSAMDTSITVSESSNGGAGCTFDTLIITRTYTVTTNDGNTPPGNVETETCIQRFFIVNTAMSCSNLVNVSLDENCEAEITGCTILRDPRACCDDFNVMVGTCENIGTDCPSLPNIIDGTYLGETLYVKVIDPLSNATCWGLIYIEDKLDPSLTCGSDTISCTQSIDPEDLGFPVPLGTTVTDNNDGTYSISGSLCDSSILSYRDIPGATTCSGDFGQIIFRDWVAEDLSGNQTQCRDTIFIRQGGLADIRMPPNYDGLDEPAIACNANFPALSNGFPDTSFTGSPTGSACFNIMIAFTDDPGSTFNVCGGTRKLLRRWTFLDWCNGAIADSFQVIKIADTNAPIIVCPGDTIAPANQGRCQGSFVLPQPSITDSCSGTFYTVSLSPQLGTLNQINDSTYQVSNLDTGTYEVTYIAYDSCGNSDTCSYNLTIEDQLPPQAVCDSVTVAPLNIDGVSRVLAASFDDGSFDDCADPVFFKVRRQTTRACNNLNGDDDPSTPLTIEEWFDDTLKMCCDDVGFSVAVILRVYDVNPGDGPVDESRHQIGGDLYGHFSDCVVIALTQDNVMPTLTVPADMTVSCTVSYNINDTASLNTAFGSAIFGDDCGAPSLTQIASISNTCPSDTIRRAFTVTDGQGNTRSGTQVIVIQTPAVLTGLGDVNFPANITITNCDADPINTLEPTFNVSNSCSLFGTSFVDDTIAQNNTGTCPYYIERTWSVIEVCPVTLDTIAGPFTQVTPQRIDINDDSAPSAPLSTFSFTFDANQDANATFTITARDIDSLGNNGVRMAFDTCTSYGQLRFVFQGNGTDSSRTIGCNTVQSYTDLDYRVIDQCENATGMSGVIDISVTGCPTVNRVAGGIIGRILSEAGEGVDDVIVQLEDQSNNGIEFSTGPDGDFHFPDLIADQRYMVKPSKDLSARNGVSTYDLVMISKHITGKKELETPYQRIAADINSSGEITTFDVIELRKIILYINDRFPSNSSWRFVEEDFVFPASDPFTTIFPEVFEVDALHDPMTANFVAMKVGDVNGSARANINSPAQTRDFPGIMNLKLEDLMLKQDQEYRIPIRSADIRQLTGFEFALQFDTDAMEYLGMEPGKLPDMNENNIGTTLLEDGVLITSWHQAQAISMDDDDELFYLKFKALESLPLDQALFINNDYTSNEAYRSTANDQIERLRIQLAQIVSKEGFTLFQNQPNPFKENTIIGFRLPKATKARLTIYDIGGKVVKRIDGEYTSGYHEIDLQHAELNSNGVLYYRLDTPEYSAVKKMTLLD